MAPSLRYVIEFVADMDRAVGFYRDSLGFAVRFESPEWSELTTGETTLALHPASAANPPGTVQLGFTAADLADTLYRGMADNSVGRVIENLLRNDLVIVDLCRHRDYAEDSRMRSR